MTRYFEDLPEGTTVALGTTTVTQDDIVGFARSWDPQSFHLDPTAASASTFGGLIASGVHTLALYMRLFVDGLLGDAASLGSPGIDELRWPTPLRPDDRITATYLVESARISASRPAWGIVRGVGEAHNQHNETVLRMTVVNLFGRRPSAAHG